MSTKKTVYYIGNFDRPELNSAGKRVYGNALIFENIGYRVVLIGKSKNETLEFTPERYSKSIFYYSFPNCSLTNTGTFLKHFKTIVEKEGEPDVVVRYGSPGIALFDKAIIKYCKKIACPVIADVVDWLPSGGSNVLFNTIKAVDTYLEKAVYNKRSSGIIVISSFLSDYYKKYGCKNVIVIPPVVERYKRNTFQSEGNTVYIVYAGIPFRLGRKVSSPKEVKDRLDLAVEGLMTVPDGSFSIVFDIYGISEEEYLTAYPKHRSLIIDNRERVFFHGKQPMVKIQDAVNKADLTILLRDVSRATSAGFPTKVVESLSCGTPVITTNTSDLDKYIHHNINGFFVDIGNNKNLASQLRESILYYFDRKNEIKENCYSEKQFLPDKFEDLLEQFLSDVRGAK